MNVIPPQPSSHNAMGTDALQILLNFKPEYTKTFAIMKLILQPFQLRNRGRLFRMPCFIGLNSLSGRMIHLKLMVHPMIGEFLGLSSRSVSSLVHSFTSPLGSKDWALIQYMLIIIVLNVRYNILKKRAAYVQSFRLHKLVSALKGFGFFQILPKQSVVRCRGLVSRKNIRVYLVDLYFLIRNLR